MRIERRQEPRRQTRIPARVLIDGSARPCIIADISSMGARLEFGLSSIELPQKFVLDMTQDGSVLRLCEVRHRTGITAGVQFIPASKATINRHISDAQSERVTLEKTELVTIA
jgi:hypothetical protein